MHRRLMAIAFAFLCSTCATITVRPPYGPLPPTCGDAPADLTAVTFNAGLGPGIVPFSTPRAPHVAAALARTRADVMCLQEVWMDADRDAIIAGLGLPPANVFTTNTVGMNEMGDRCEPGVLSSLMRCVSEKCADADAEETTNCALSQCESSLRGIFFSDSDCLSCMAAMAGHSADEIRETCTGPRGASRIYGGRNGIILASRWPLTHREVVMVPSSGANRLALVARISPPGSEPIEVACTHLSSGQKIPPFHTWYSSWDEEKAAQLFMITDRLRARSGPRPTLFLGDMNFGAGKGDTVEGEDSWVWYEAITSGYDDPAAYASPALCSACSDNLFRRGSRSYLIDHVLVRDPPGGTTLAPMCAERVLDEPVTITYRGEARQVHISDHFGISVRFDLR